MNNLLPLGYGAWTFISIYLLSLLLIGWFAKKSRKEDTLSDFYLAGKGLGIGILFLTLFATQYSGNTFFGFTGATYRIGYAWILSIHFMTSIVVCYLLFAPKLHRLSKKYNFLTPADYIQHRYNYKKLSLIITIIGIAVLSNYLLAQLMAMGRAMQGISGDTGGSFYIAGVLVLATIIVIYGTMGGLRAVAWTDAIQGVILLVGFTVLLIILFDKFGPLSKATAIIANMDDINNTRKSLVPDSQTCRLWLSYIIILGFGLSLYPQAIQRIYAAKSEKVLKQSLAVMAFMPIPTMIISVIAGIMALAYISGLEGAATDQVFGQVLREVQEYSLLGYGLSVVILAAILAAMMSTADSALLTISSMFTKDIYAKIFKKTPNEKSLILVGKFCSWGFLALMIVFAIILKDNTSLVKLMDRKLDLMIQVSPAFMLGIHFIWLKAKPVFWGIICGTIIALSIPYLDFSFISKGKVFGFHAGLVGVVPNLAIALIGSYFERKKT
jgi:SSS family solute:Na+ symporter/sodium/pantothenate symporter